MSQFLMVAGCGTMGGVDCCYVLADFYHFLLWGRCRPHTPHWGTDFPRPRHFASSLQSQIPVISYYLGFWRFLPMDLFPPVNGAAPISGGDDSGADEDLI